MTLEETIKCIRQPEEAVRQQAWERWDHVAKPLRSLGSFEKIIADIAAMTGSAEVSLDKRAVVIFCSDHGIVEEGVTQTGQEVTAVVSENFSMGKASVCLMAEQAGAYVLPVDMGVSRDLEGYGDIFSSDGQKSARKYPILNRKISYGTKNFLKEPAMTREEAVKALETGIHLAFSLKERGFQILATGEMGIGNTTASSAVVSVLLEQEPEKVTGAGAGLDKAGIIRKAEVIREGIARWKPDKRDGLDVLSKVGGYDLAGMAGLFLGGAAAGIPVVADGFISGAAALLAASICPAAKDYMIASHVSAEPAGKMVLDALGLKPVIFGQMSLGEGTGAVMLFPLLDMALSVYKSMSTFQEISIAEYKHFDKEQP